MDRKALQEMIRVQAVGWFQYWLVFNYWVFAGAGAIFGASLMSAIINGIFGT